MRRLLTAVLIGFGTLGTLPVQAGAQESPVHEGFWISFGLGGGWADDDFFDDGETGGAAWLRMGGSPGPDLLIGGEVIGWASSEDDTNTDIGRGNIQFVALYYPDGPGGPFLKGGAGLAVRTVDTDIVIGDDEFTLTRDTEGVGLNAGAGWDIRLARNFFLSPTLDFVYQFLDDDQSAAMILFTIGATWH